VATKKKQQKTILKQKNSAKSMFLHLYWRHFCLDRGPRHSVNHFNCTA